MRTRSGSPTYIYLELQAVAMAMGNPSWFALLLLAIVATSRQDVTFMQQPQDTKVVLGSSAFFPCTYTGTRGVPHWLINNTVTHVVSQLPLGHSHNGTGLIVHKVDVSMNATAYQCCFDVYTGQGIFENICSSSGMLIISAGFIEHPTSVQVAPGELGRFQCTAVATSVCSIQWKINRTLTIDSEAHSYSIPARTAVGMLSSMLHVLAVPQHNNSKVECCAYDNTGGEENCTKPVSLTIYGAQSKPGAPTSSSLLSSTSSSFTIEIQLSTEGIPPILSIAVNFTSPAGLVQSIPGPFSPGQLVRATLSGLEADTEYNLTFFAVNFNGLSPASVGINSRTDCHLCESPQPCGLGCDSTIVIGLGVGLPAAVILVLVSGSVILLGILCYRKHRKDKTKGGSPSSLSAVPDEKNDFQAQQDSGRVHLDGRHVPQGRIQSDSGTDDRVLDNQELESSPYMLKKLTLTLPTLEGKVTTL